MKNGDDILRDIRRLHDDMGFFLLENRAANVERGFPYPGPAAKKIGEALEAMNVQYRALVFPEGFDARSDRGGKGGVAGLEAPGEGLSGPDEAPGGPSSSVAG